MSLEENKEIVRKVYDACNKRDYAAFDALATPEIAASWKQAVQWFNATFEDWHIEMTDMIAEGDKVWCRYILSGGHSAEFEGIPPTGKHWTNPGAEFYRIVEGRTVEIEFVSDTYNHLKQLGTTVVLPPVPEKA